MTIKWTKRDFLEKIQEAMKPVSLTGQAGMQTLKDKLLAFRAGQNSTEQKKV